MAYFSGDLVPGICLHSSGRKPGVRSQACEKYYDCVDSDRILAWRRLELRILGALLRSASSDGKVSAAFRPGESAGIVTHLYTMLLVMAGWVFFFSPSMGEAVSYLGNMVGVGGAGFVDSTGIYYLTTNLILLAVMALCATPKVYEWFRQFSLADSSLFRLAGTILVYAGIFVASAAYLVNVTYNPFLYFRF